MNRSTTKIVLLGLILLLSASACSRKGAKNAASAGPPRLILAAKDIASPVEVVTNRFGTAELLVKLSASKAEELRKLSQAHLNEQVELVVGSKVVAKPLMRHQISGGEFKLSFSSPDEARSVADSLSGK